MAKRIEMTLYTDKGAVDEKNQDRVLFQDAVYEEGFYQGDTIFPCIAAVCDGVGGYAFGERASGCITKYLASSQQSQWETKENLAALLNEAAVNLLELKQSNPENSRMLTTIAGIALMEDKVLVFHAGDSRVYRLRGQYLNKMTKDHSLAQEQIDSGNFQGDPEQALAECSTITRCLGKADSFPPEVSEYQLPPQKGDLYMLCSDGIWSALSFDQIENIMCSNPDLSDIAAELSQTALEQGSLDNLSVCLIRVTEENETEDRPDLELD